MQGRRFYLITCTLRFGFRKKLDPSICELHNSESEGSSHRVDRGSLTTKNFRPTDFTFDLNMSVTAEIPDGVIHSIINREDTKAVAFRVRLSSDPSSHLIWAARDHLQKPDNLSPSVNLFRIFFLVICK